MRDTVVAFPTGREKPTAAWKMDCGFGYEHVPSMLIEIENELFFRYKAGRGLFNRFQTTAYFVGP